MLTTNYRYVTDSCTFFNATGYADYTGCSPRINKQIYKDIKAGTAPVPWNKKCEYESYYSDKDWKNYCEKPEKGEKPKKQPPPPPKDDDDWQEEDPNRWD